MVLFLKSSWVWLPHPKEAWVPVQLLDLLPSGDKIDCRTSLDEHYEVALADDLKPVHPSSLQPIENLVNLEELSEGAILHNLRSRYEKNEIYTYISSIIISINPYKMLPYYGPSTIEKYRDGLSRRELMPPHVYALADAAYKSLTIDNANQSVIISGESGAGKTEATKLVLQYLADIAGQGDDIEQQILESNPIVEAFGNAKTVRNNNSSRFGKWIEIQFSDKYKIAGSKIYNYLLEKSRVVQQAKGERNYHVYYQLIAGASDEDRARYRLKPAQEFALLNGGECVTVEGINDKEDYLEVIRAMEILNFPNVEIEGIFRTLAAILHIGNIKFKQIGDKAAIESADELGFSAELLLIKPESLEKSLCTRLLNVNGETITTFNNEQTAKDARDALCKSLYDSIFNALIDRINQTLSQKTGSVADDRKRICGVLDIFGFECFEKNYFEQFCINWGNEKLQQHFTLQVFTLEAEEYKKEEIDVAQVQFVDNQMCLDLIELRRTGIVDMIGEEIRLPKGSEATLLQKMHSAFEKHQYYVKPKLGTPTFLIKHYAGNVEYAIEKFLDKNRDNLGDDLVACIESSDDPFVCGLLEFGRRPAAASSSLATPPPAESANRLSPRPSVSVAGTSPGGPGFARVSGSISISGVGPLLNRATMSVEPHSRRSLSFGTGGPMAPRSIATVTLGQQFRSQLADLMVTLNSTRANFIRCIKPNNLKIADNFDAPFVVRQLQYLGIKEVINIRQLGFPVRLHHKDFFYRYKILLPHSELVDSSGQPITLASIVNSPALLQKCQLILESQRIGQDQFRIGKTKILFKNPVQSILEAARESKLIRLVILLQSIVRAKHHRRSYKRLKLCVEKVKSLLATEAEYSVTVQPSDGAKMLEQLDQTIEEAVDLELPNDLLTPLKKYRHSLNLIIVNKNALIAAIGSKDVELLNQAIEGARAANIAESTAELAQAVALLNRIKSYQSGLAAAIEARSIDEIQKFLAQGTEELQLNGRLEMNARNVLKRLIEERNADSELGDAVQSKNIELLHRAIKKALEIGLTSASLTQAQNLLVQLEKEKAIRDALSAALSTQDMDLIQSAIEKAEAAGMAQDPLTLQAIDQKSRLTRQLKTEQILKNVVSAIQSNNLDLLHSAIKQARDNSLEGEAAVADAVKKIHQIEKRNAIKEFLGKAIESRQIDSIQAAIKRAQQETAELAANQNGFSLEELDEYRDAAQLQQKIHSITGRLGSFTAEERVSDLEALVEECNGLGLFSLVESINATLKSLTEKLEAEKLLKTAIETKQEGILQHAISKGEELEKVGRVNAELLKAAKQAMDDLKAEARIHEQEMAQAQAEAEQAAAPTVQISGPPSGAETPVQEQKSKSKRDDEDEDDGSDRPGDLPALAVPGLPTGGSRDSFASPTRPMSHTQYHPAPRRTTIDQPLKPKKNAPILNESYYVDKHHALHLFTYLRTPDDFARGKLFGKQKVKTTMLVWTKEVLPKSLTKLGDDKTELNQSALQVFKSLQGFMLDRMYSFPDGLASEILTIGLQSKLLRDEIYLQIVKQIQQNPKPESILRGFQLMGLASETFPPTTAFKPYLFNWILSSPYRNDPSYKDYINYTLRTLQLEIEAESAPTIEHVTAFRERIMKSATMAIHFTDGSIMHLEMDPSINTAAVCDSIAELIGLSDEVLVGFGIFMCGPGPEELFIDPKECLLDFPAAKCTDRSIYYLFKKRMIFEDDPGFKSPIALNLIYHQCLLDAFQNVYDLPKPELLTILATHRKIVESAFFPQSIGEMDENVEEIKNLLPLSILESPEPERQQFMEEMEKTKQQMVDLPDPVKFIQMLQQRKEFNCQLFLVRQEEQKNIPEIILLGVNLFGVFLIDETSKQVYNSFKFVHVTGWANNAVRFCLRVLVAKGKTVQFNFATTQGKRITQSVQDYIDFLVKLQRQKKAAASGTPPDKK